MVYETSTSTLKGPGGISDTEYMSRSGVFSYQERFVKACSAFSNIKFTSIVDKGYRCVLAAWRAGRQLLLQPAFARSDRKFNSDEVLTSAAVASDRSANERAVNVAKRAGFLSRGVDSAQDVGTVADVWLAWSFQCNFMFKPVL